MTLLLVLMPILLVIIFLPVKISLDYYRLNHDDNLQVNIEALFGLIHYRLELSYIKIRRRLLAPILELRAEFFGVKGKAKEDEVKEEFGPGEMDLKTFLSKLKFLLKMTDKLEALFTMMESFQHEDQHSHELRMENPVVFRTMGMLVMGLCGDCRKLVWQTRFGFTDAALTGMANGLIWTGKTICLDLLSMICNMKTTPQLNVVPDFQRPGLDVQFESIFSVRIGNIMITGIKILLEGYKRRSNYRWPIIQLRD